MEMGIETMEKKTEPSDVQVIDGILSGDTEQFQLLLDRYQSYIFAIVRRYVPAQLVEDVAQEVCIKLFRSLELYQPQHAGKDGRGGNGTFKSWLATIAVRTSYDALRKMYRSSEVAMSELTDNHSQWLDSLQSASSQEDFIQHSQAREAKEILAQVMSKLSPEDHMVIRLVHFEGNSTAQAAKMLGWSSANVKIRTFRARNKLQGLIRSLLGENLG